MNEQHLDDAIDRAVRDLMDVDADTAFRAQVLERLEQSKSRRAGWRPLALAGGAALALVFAVVLNRTPEPAPVTISVANPPSAASAPLSAPAAPAGRHEEPRRAVVATAPAHEPTVHAVAASQIPRGRMVATVAPDEAVATIEPLESIEPITVAPLDTPRIATEQVVVPPLAAIEGVQIEPLAPRIERD